MVIYNVVLGVFNLWPFPPLDGANALRYLSMQFGWRPVVDLLNRIEPVHAGGMAYRSAAALATVSHLCGIGEER